MNNPDPTLPVAEKKERKMPVCIQKIKAWADTHLTYERLIILDAVLAVIHVTTMCIVWIQWLMLFTLVFIRGTRMFLWGWSKRTQQPVWYDREYKFRKYSTWFYFPIALGFQVLTMFTNYCKNANDEYSCRMAYFFTFLVLLILYVPIDLLLYRIVSNNYATKFPNGVTKEEQPAA